MLSVIFISNGLAGPQHCRVQQSVSIIEIKKYIFFLQSPMVPLHGVCVLLGGGRGGWGKGHGQGTQSYELLSIMEIL